MGKTKLFVPLIGTFLIMLLLMNVPAVLAANTFGGLGSLFGGGDSSNSVANSNANYQIVGSSSNPQFNQPSFGFSSGSGFNLRSLWPSFGDENCENRNDMILMIPPGGCSPAVVRSDLLEEQNVPVFCKVTSIELNPLIDITKIKSIRFSGKQPEGIQSVSYFPARAAIRSGRTLKASPVADNIGYLVVVLSSRDYEGAEKNMPDFLEGNVTATIDYETDGIFGVGSHSFFLNEFSEEEWLRNYRDSGFWNGKGYIRATEIEEDSAIISVYQDQDIIFSEKRLNEGETSNPINLEGYYCSAGMKLKLESIDYPQETALIRVDDQEFWVGRNSRFLDGQCRVLNLDPFSVGGGIMRIKCNGAPAFSLLLNPAKVDLEVWETEPGNTHPDGYADNSSNIRFKGEGPVRTLTVAPGDTVTTKNVSLENGNYELRTVFASYIGKVPDSGTTYIVMTSATAGTAGFEGISEFIHNTQKYYFKYGYEIELAQRRLLTGGVAIGATLLLGPFGPIAGTLLGTAGAGTTDIILGLPDKEESFYTYLTTELADRYEIGAEDLKIILSHPEPLAHTWMKYGIKYDESYTGEDLLNNNSELKNYYETSIGKYTDLFELYPNELNGENTGAEPYAAIGLINAGDLSGRILLEEEQRRFYDFVVDHYPETNLADSAKSKLNLIGTGFSRDSQALVNMNEDSHFISLLNLKGIELEELGAEIEFYVQGHPVNNKLLGRDSEIKIPNTDISFKINEIRDNQIDIEVAPPAQGIRDNIRDTIVGVVSTVNLNWESKTLTLGQKVNLVRGYDDVPEIGIRVNKINLNKQARVRIIPEVKGTRTEADFKYKIGIEKRAIQLSPERTKKLIKNIQEQIKKWTDINEKLGKIVKGLKTACFATSAVLNIKNFFTGLGGAAQARNELMTGYWNQNCRRWSGDTATASEYTNRDYETVEACLLDHNDQINSDVEKYTEIINKQNDNFDRIHENLPEDARTSDWFFTDSYDTDAVTDSYREGPEFTGLDRTAKYTLPDGSNRSIASVIDDHERSLTVEEMRDLVTFSQLPDSPTLNQMREERIGNLLGDIDRRLAYDRGESAIQAAHRAGNYSGAIPPSLNLGSSQSTRATAMHALGEADAREYNFTQGNRVVSLNIVGSLMPMVNGTRPEGPDRTIEDQQVYVELRDLGNGVWSYNRGIIAGRPYNNDTDSRIRQHLENQNIGLSFTEADEGYYRNPYREDAVVRYYERAPYKGLPALVPFDNNNGWYVATDYVVSGFGKPFEDSGRAINFWICNVGKNGLFEFKRGDDCRYYNAASPGSALFPGLSEGESRSLVSQAQNALRQASQQYGRREVRINNQRYSTEIAENGASGSCTDFMSPKECNLMFNVCDPVICPSSRCDFGGAYRVDNVIQSGIIGSLMLCLLNFPEVKVPICLSGVHAGIDGYISILNSTEGCLQESLDTGRNVGICDEIKSIYLCEFFWKQLVPLLDVAIPRAFETVLGQGARGGGEYSTVQAAYDNTQKSIEYFRNEYAVNSFNAFNIRSTEELGGPVCKSFVGTKYPSSASMLNNLVEPDSPVQYSGWFDENILNTATIPPTAHYKVYYHIFAGKDGGAQYVVSLKGDSDTGLIRSTGNYVVDRGYIPKGGQVDEAKDFVATSGFTKLCISVNGKEDCNFKQVSTSAALNFIRDKYAEDQASEIDITKSDECVAGKSSLLSVVQPNIQAGVEEAIQPELYKRGIVRVCSTNNPGSQVDVNQSAIDPTRSRSDRWMDVGYCDDKSIRCWVDTGTVKDVLAQNKILLNNTLSAIESSYFDDINFTTIEEGDEIINAARNWIKTPGGVVVPTEILRNLETLENIGPNNNYRAYSLFLQAEIYRILAEGIYDRDVAAGMAARAERDKVYQQGINEREAEDQAEADRQAEANRQIEARIQAAREAMIADRFRDKFVSLKDSGGKYVSVRINEANNPLQSISRSFPSTWERFYLEYHEDEEVFSIKPLKTVGHVVSRPTENGKLMAPDRSSRIDQRFNIIYLEDGNAVIKSLRTSNYVGKDSDNLIANIPNIQDAERFEIVEVRDKVVNYTIAIKSTSDAPRSLLHDEDYRYVSIYDEEGSLMGVRANHIREWELFEVYLTEELSSDVILPNLIPKNNLLGRTLNLASVRNGKFISTHGDNFLKNSRWEPISISNFTIEEAGDDKYYIKAYNNKYVRVNSVGDFQLIADRDSPEPEDSFEIIMGAELFGYKLKSNANDDLCLDISGGSDSTRRAIMYPESSPVLQVRDCDETISQKWRFDSGVLINKISFVDSRGNSMDLGCLGQTILTGGPVGQARLRSFCNEFALDVSFIYDDSKRLKFVQDNTEEDYCLEASSDNYVRAAICNTEPNQKWIFDGEGYEANSFIYTNPGMGDSLPIAGFENTEDEDEFTLDEGDISVGVNILEGGELTDFIIKREENGAHKIIERKKFLGITISLRTVGGVRSDGKVFFTQGEVSSSNEDVAERLDGMSFNGEVFF